MKWLSLLFAVVVVPAEASDVCAERLWRQLRGLPTATEVEDDALARLTTYRHDALLMEIEFVKPGSVDQAHVTQVAFRPLVGAHANLRRSVERLRAHNFTLKSPGLRERAYGRAAFRESLNLFLETLEAWRLVRAFWAEWSRRLPEGKAFGTMQLRLSDIERELIYRGSRLIEQAGLVERREPRFEEVFAFISEDGRGSRGEFVRYLSPYLVHEYELHLAEADRRERHLEAVARRRAWRVIPGDRD